MIFDKIGESVNNYMSIRLFTTSPVLTEFLVNSKTISQCNLKEWQKIVVQGQYIFYFDPIPKDKSKYINLTNNSSTLQKVIPEKIQENRQPEI